MIVNNDGILVHLAFVQSRNPCQKANNSIASDGRKLMVVLTRLSAAADLNRRAIGGR